MDWQVLLRIIRAIFGGQGSVSVGDEPEVPLAEGPSPSRAVVDDHEDAPAVEVAVYSTQELIETNGRVSESVVARYVRESLAPHFNVEVHRAFEPVDKNAEAPPDFNRLTLRSQIIRWNQHPKEFTAKDANLLLTAAESGGASFASGQFGICPAGHITDEYAYREQGETTQDRNIYGCLHEMWHLFGSESKPGEHWGMGWNEGEKWHKSPSLHGNNEKNECGEFVPLRRRDGHENVVRHFAPSSCEVSQLRERLEG